MKRLLVTLVILVASAFSQTTEAGLPEHVIVTLFEAYPPTNGLMIEGPFEVHRPLKSRIPSGQYQLVVKNQRLQLKSLNNAKETYKLPEGNRYVIQGTSPQGLEVRPSTLLKRRYGGTLEITLNPQGCLVVKNHINTREYVMAVVGSETLHGWPLEALKAQAVLTQTRLTRYRPGDPLGDSTQREAYLGSDHIRPEVRQAVIDTWGEVLTYDNRPITPYYHAACGGKTSEGSFFFGKPVAYLSSVTCTHCHKSPFWQETLTLVPYKMFAQIFGRDTPKILRYDGSDRPLSVRLINGDILTGYAFWLRMGQKLGWDKAPGTRFRLATGEDSTISITSNGAGHGVGLCQWGAAELARQGKTHRELLSYYFPKAQLQAPSPEKANIN